MGAAVDGVRADPEVVCPFEGLLGGVDERLVRSRVRSTESSSRMTLDLEAPRRTSPPVTMSTPRGRDAPDPESMP